MQFACKDHCNAILIADGYPPVVFPSIHVLVENLDLHVITASWDLQFLACLSESTRTKTTTVDVQGMKNGSQASKTGKLFYDTLKVRIDSNDKKLSPYWIFHQYSRKCHFNRLAFSA